VTTATPILAIDPGRHSGLTGWTSAIVHAARVEIPDRLPCAVMIPALQAALDAMGNPDPATVRVVIEGWLNPRGIPAIKSLHRCKEAWLDAAAELGIDHTSEVESNTWQRAMGCTGESDNRKLVSKCIAAPVLRTAGLPCPENDHDLDENVADATCLGLWWVEEHRFGVTARVLATDGKKVSKAARAATGRRGGFTTDDLKAFQARGMA
jgi:hypothetical protein